VLKINSRDIVHKSDVGGVRLNLTSAQAVHTAVAEIEDDSFRSFPPRRV